MSTAKTLTPERIEELKYRSVDLSDIPEITAEQWKNGHFRNQWKPIKKTVSVRLDMDVLEAFKAGGKGYQTRINAALRKAVEDGFLIAK